MSSWKFFAAVGIIAALLVGFYGFEQWQVVRERDENRYNGFDFALAADNVWVTRLEIGSQPYNVPFHHHPRETEDVIVHENVTEALLSDGVEHVFISLDPDAGSQPVVAGVEIAKITGSRYDILNLPTQSALSRPAETAVDVPVVSCSTKELIPEGTVVVQFVHDPSANAIVRDGPCVLLFYRTPEDSIRVADRYAFMLLGIM